MFCALAACALPALAMADSHGGSIHLSAQLYKQNSPTEKNSRLESVFEACCKLPYFPLLTYRGATIFSGLRISSSSSWDKYPLSSTIA